MKKMMSVVLLLSCAGLAMAQVNSSKITIGTLYLSPPFVYNAFTGFDINLMQAICVKEHLQCQFVHTTFDSLMTELRLSNSKINVAISAISITDRRSQNYLFVGPYYQSSMSFLAKEEKNPRLSLAQLKQKSVGVMQGTIFYGYVQGILAGANNIKSYDTEEDMLAALGDGKVDVISLDTPVAEYWQNKSNCQLKIISAPIKIPGDYGYGIVLHKADVRLQAKLAEGLALIKADGTYATLVDTYFGKQRLSCVAR